jgi:hypothetical protein
MLREMRQRIRELVDETLAALRAQGTVSYDVLPTYTVEVPKTPAHGDWSCNVAMTLVKSNPGKKSVELAGALIAGLVDRHGVVAHVERAGPGFLNSSRRPPSPIHEGPWSRLPRWLRPPPHRCWARSLPVASCFCPFCTPKILAILRPS